MADVFSGNGTQIGSVFSPAVRSENHFAASFREIDGKRRRRNGGEGRAEFIHDLQSFSDSGCKVGDPFNRVNMKEIVRFYAEGRQMFEQFPQDFSTIRLKIRTPLKMR